MAKPEKQTSPLQQLLRRIKRIATRNWATKLLSLLIAIMLWAGLISQDASLTRERTFTDVTINVIGAESLKRSGYIVTNITKGDIDNATMTVSVPQTQYQNVTVTNYNPRIDLSRINSTGTQELSVTTSSTSTYGSVISINPASVTVEVDSYITRYRIPISLNTTGEMPEGYWSTAPSSDPQYISISGPATQVRSVVRGIASMDLATLPAQEGAVSTAVTFVLYDSEGNEVDQSMMELTSDSMPIDSVLVSQTLYSTKTIQLSALGITTGEPAHGYQVANISVSPASVTVAADADTLESLDSLFTIGSVNIDDAEETFQTELTLRKPSEVVWLSADSATVVVEIEPSSSSASFANVRLSMTGLETGMSANLSVKSVTASATGPLLTIEKLRQGQFSAVVDLSGITEAGTYNLPVEIRLSTDADDLVLSSDPAEISVEIGSR